MTKIYNRTQVQYYRRLLRKNNTSAERILWKHLCKKQLIGYRFLRQYSVSHYILDFYCPRARLAIELDGAQHLDKEHREYDQLRTLYLQSLGIRVVRFQNWEIKYRVKEVLETIHYHLEH